MGTNVEIVRELYEAFAAADRNRIRAVFADDIEWLQMDGFPNGGRWVGADVVFNNVLDKLNATWDNWKSIGEEYLDAGDQIVVLGYYSGMHKISGGSFKALFAHVYTLVDGKIVRFEQFTDTAKIVEATLKDISEQDRRSGHSQTQS